MGRLYPAAYQFTDGTEATPAVLGSLTFSVSGSATAKAVYSDASLSTSSGATVNLDSEGRTVSEVFGSGSYRVRLWSGLNGTGTNHWTKDDVRPVGNVEYGTTAAETSAGITISNPEYLPYEDPRRYGYIGDLAQDESTVLQAYANLLATLDSGTNTESRLRPKFVIPAGTAARIASPISIGTGINVQMDGPIVVYGTASAGATWVTIGAGSGGDAGCTRNGDYVIDVVRNTHSDWSNSADVGLLIQSICESRIFIKRASYFYSGFIASAGGYAFGYNTVTLGAIRGCKYGAEIKAPTGSVFANQCLWLGGEFATGTGEGVSNSACYGWRINDGTAAGIQSHTFLGQSYELSQSLAGAEDAIPVLISTADCNTNSWLRQRNEGSAGSMVDMKVTADARDNTFEELYALRSSAYPGVTHTVNDASRYKSNRVICTRFTDRLAGASLIWDSNNIAKRSNIYNGSTTVAVGGFDIADSTFAMYAAQDNISVSGLLDSRIAFAASGRNLVRWIDTTTCKRVIVEVDIGDTASTYVFQFKPYDANGLLMTDDPTPGHVVGEDSSFMGAWSAGSFTDGAYGFSGAISAPSFWFSVSTSTKKVALIFAGAASRYIKAMRIWSQDGPCSTWVEARAPFDNGELIASAVPTAGTWDRGTVLYRDDATSGATAGWVCTTAGTFGALSAVNCATTSGSRSATLAATSALAVGEYISIAGVSGTKRVVGKNGTSIVLDTAADATVAAGAVAYVSAVFKAMANLA